MTSFFDACSFERTGESSANCSALTVIISAKKIANSKILIKSIFHQLTTFFRKKFIKKTCIFPLFRTYFFTSTKNRKHHKSTQPLFPRNLLCLWKKSVHFCHLVSIWVSAVSIPHHKIRNKTIKHSEHCHIIIFYIGSLSYFRGIYLKCMCRMPYTCFLLIVNDFHRFPT